MKYKRPYTGVCFNAFHAEQLYLRLQQQVFKAMRDEDDPLFEPGLASLLKSKKSQKPGIPGPEPKKPEGEPQKKKQKKTPNGTNENENGGGRRCHRKARQSRRISS